MANKRLVSSNLVSDLVVTGNTVVVFCSGSRISPLNDDCCNALLSAVICLCVLAATATVKGAGDRQQLTQPVTQPVDGC